MLFREKLKPYYTFTASERRGVIVLLIILCFLIAVRIYLPTYYKRSSSSISYAGNLLPSESDNKAKENWNSANKVQILEASSRENLAVKINEANRRELLNSGFSNFVVSNILKYRQSGGVFYNREDLSKIYGLDSASMRKVEMKCKLVFATIQSAPEKHIPANSPLRVEINSADSSALMKINGIGSVLSKRIIKYRESLGGFCSRTQLLEVYGVNSEVYYRISTNLIVDSLSIHKLNINSANEKTLANHPYISNYQAKAIIEYRKKMKRVNDLTELKVNNIFSAEEFEKLARYLVLD
jgi:competence protein ComEA